QFHLAALDEQHHGRCARNHFRQRRSVENRVFCHRLDFRHNRPISIRLVVNLSLTFEPQDSAWTLIVRARLVNGRIPFAELPGPKWPGLLSGPSESRNEGKYESPTQSGRGQPHSKTLARCPARNRLRKVVECGSPMPLSRYCQEMS